MFVWTETARPRGTNARNTAAREAMYRRELEERAALLLRLGNTPAYVKQRLLANVAWDFELAGHADHATEVERIVDGLARRSR